MVVTGILVGVVFLIAALSFVPMLPSPRWWIRALEFPRLQILGLQVMSFLAAFWHGAQVGLVLMVGLGVAMATQIVHIWPFTPLCRKEMRRTHEDSAQDITCLAMNVLMENQNHAAVCAEIARVDADVVFLMETDAIWDAALAKVLATYPTIVREIKDNYYGLIFATRLKVRSIKVAYLSVEDTPAVIAELESPDGTPFRYLGLHPKPPVPGEDTEGRDAEVAYAARHAKETGMPVIAMGDFNTPAWSQIAHRFKVVGGYLDPRVGRGPLPSFDANRWWLRIPIDQFYATEEVCLVRFRRGRKVGSDHFPMLARVRMNDPDAARRLNRRVTALPDAEEDRVLRAIERQGQRLKKVTRHASPPAP